MMKTLGSEQTDRKTDRQKNKGTNTDKHFNIAAIELKPCVTSVTTQGLVQIHRFLARKLARILGLWNSKGHQRTPTH